MAEAEVWDEFSERLRDLETMETAPDLISPYLALTGLRGFWPMSAFQSNGDCFDQSGNARLLTYNGNPTYNYDGLAPYLEMDGVGDFLERFDEAGLDIIGTETYIDAAVRGLTMGGWIWVTATGTDDGFMTKWNDLAGFRGYRLKQGIGGPPITFAFEISSDGTAITSVSSDANSLTTGVWHFLVGRFDPSAELAIFLNSDKNTNVAAIPASIVNNAESFMIGAQAPAGVPIEHMTGRASLCFLCAAYLSDDIIIGLFDQTRGAFGV